jgi:uncharacterized protein YndB with AHSA1/START domain
MAARSDSAVESAARDVVITRVFDAPRELVFKAWTDREHLSRWYAPRGCTITFRTLDVREGGVFHSCIRSPDGHACWCKGVYREVVEPKRIVQTLVITNEHGDSVEAADVGMDPDWPAETILTVTFDDLGGKTKVTLHQTVSETLAKRTGAHPSWIDMLDRLAEDLTTETIRS